MANLSAQQQIALAFLQAALVSLPVWLAASKFFINQVDDISVSYFTPDLILVMMYISLLFIVEKSMVALNLQSGPLQDAGDAIYAYLLMIGGGMLLLLTEQQDEETIRGYLWYAVKLVIVAGIIAGLFTGLVPWF